MPPKPRTKPPRLEPQSTPTTDVLRLTTAEGNAREVEREPLFEIDGVEYTIPTQFSANVGLEFMRLAQVDYTAAMFYVLNYALGEGGYRALAAYPNLREDELNFVTRVVIRKVVGTISGPKAN